MRKGRDGEKQEKKNGEKTGKKREKTDGNSGHYVIASSRPPERQPLECRRLVPIFNIRVTIKMQFNFFKNNKTRMYRAYKVAPEFSMLMNSLEY